MQKQLAYFFLFLLGKATGFTIPRLELCAAVQGLEVHDIIREELEVEFRQDEFFTNSNVVLCFIGNEIKRFHTYIRNCVGIIRNS